MDNQREETMSKSIKNKIPKRKEKKHKSRKLLRRKSLKSVGNFMNRILKTLSTLSHFGDLNPAEAEAEDDDGGFRASTAPCTLTANSGHLNEESRAVAENPVKKSLTLSSQESIKERLSWCFGDRIPGVLGLKNHGNTCFMNAVVQCLSNTDLFAEYLGLEQYKVDLSHRQVNGMLKNDDVPQVKGEVTKQLASLMRALWTLDYTPQLSVEFKNTVSKYGSQFRGNSQHDALEFLLWLLDQVHEDVNSSPGNTNNTKPIGKTQSGEETPGGGQPATETPGSQSFVREHFQAQYRSSLTCPHCLKQSNTFDPFLCISLPIPLRQTRPLYITLVFHTKGQRYLRIGLAVPLFGTVASLREMVSMEGKITPEQVILTEVYSTGFQRSFFNEEELTSIAESDNIYAFQAPPIVSRGGSARVSGYHHSLPSSPYSSGPEGQRLPPTGTLSSEFLNHSSSGKVLLLICNAAGSGEQAVRFGPPFLMREDRAISWDQLQQCILSKMYYLMISEAQTQNVGVLFRIRVVGGSITCSYLSPQDSQPLYHPAVDRALRFCGLGGPPHVKLVIEWDHKAKDGLFGNIQEEVVQDAESVRAQQQQHQQQHSCTLDECFQLYTKEEQLAPDDAWKCPHCKQLQQGMVKMSLWTLPDILILHLKRFRQVGERRNKLSSLVRFPLTGLDMTPHMVKRSHSSRNLLSPWPSWKPPQQHHDFLYDLYAVCNHHGGMHGGHYTAYCRNSVDGQWYSYDDSSVDLIPEEEVSTRGAYILFYQKRNIIPPWSASSSVRGSTSSSMSDHWLIRLTEDSMRGSMASRASMSCVSPPGSPESPVFQDEPLKEERGFDTRPIVRGIQGRSVSMRTPTKTKESITKSLPLRWSFGAKERPKPVPGELVEYLESGRRPRCTKDSIVPLMTVSTDENGVPAGEPQQASVNPSRRVSMGCMGRTNEEPPNPSTKVPEGQQRQPPANEKTSTLRRSGKLKEDSTLTMRGSKKTASKAESVTSLCQGRPEDLQPNGARRSSSGGFQSYSQENTLRKSKGQFGKSGDQEPRSLEEGRGRKSEDTKTSEGKFSIFKSSFLKKDSKKPREPETYRSAEMVNGSSRTSLSNGTLNRVTQGKVNGAPGSRYKEELPNGRVSQSAVDINRSQSSSNIQSKGDLALRRTASLHKNGLAPQQPRSVHAEKHDYATLQRTRFCTTSLGRKKSVPESSF
ncbi:ubiquitin carboxyl-terminal hydrolase 43-like isoform X2 [Acipenser ruthenus]|uniref:ubiquitin carboxyl-terminal hydrolase 43-like isoform X2 n=1 Tax=Acipenser ruthenus TaxID=7906 RepID=UPI0027410104|nr:ubiquitin carboxyl-terminal hydrolase 43-like isoform X2 [Acipenser ruthenus]